MARYSDFPLISVEELALVLEKSHDGIIITDCFGNTVYSTPSADYGIAPYTFKNNNVRNMVKEGIFNHSVIWEATEKKRPITKAVKTLTGSYVVSTATPLLDDDKNVLMVITNVRDDNELESCAAVLREATSNIERYKNVINYISGTKKRSQNIITRSEKMLQLISYLCKVAVNESAVLITGESGTGKELMSSLIHESSRRNVEPFIPVNCAAIPRDLAESEFFGYQKGAFSGASGKGKPGFFELAHRGTLFLDEVAEMPLEIQSKFLRVLETGQFLRVGGTSPIQTSVRIISATNRNLSQCIREGTFREDLFYRLNVIPVQIPPLRERSGDILYLADYFLDRANTRNNTSYTLSANMKKALTKYDWPGNVRELKNFIERYSIMPDNENILIESLQSQPLRGTGSKGESADVSEDSGYNGLSMSLKEVSRAAESAYIKKMLEDCGGNVTLSAKRLGIHRSMLHRKIRDYLEL